MNRLTDESINGGVDACSGSSPSGIVLTYDAASNLTSYCDEGGTVTYGYNADNEVISLPTTLAVPRLPVMRVIEASATLPAVCSAD